MALVPNATYRLIDDETRRKYALQYTNTLFHLYVDTQSQYLQNNVSETSYNCIEDFIKTLSQTRKCFNQFVHPGQPQVRKVNIEEWLVKTMEYGHGRRASNNPYGSYIKSSGFPLDPRLMLQKQGIEAFEHIGVVYSRLKSNAIVTKAFIMKLYDLDYEIPEVTAQSMYEALRPPDISPMTIHSYKASHNLVLALLKSPHNILAQQLPVYRNTEDVKKHLWDVMTKGLTSSLPIPDGDPWLTWASEKVFKWRSTFRSAVKRQCDDGTDGDAAAAKQRVQ